MLTLFTDTDCDMSPATCAPYGYKLISMPYSIDGKEIRPYEDFDVFDHVAYYDSLRAGVMPSTSALNEDIYKKYFEPEFAAGNDILYVHFSEAMTMSFGAMRRAVAELQAAYPGPRFYEIDTKGITINSYAFAKDVGDMILAGKTVEDVLAFAEAEVDKYAMFFFAEDLKFFRRSGRVSGLAAIMGNLVGIRPIISIGSDGKMGSIGKEVGRNKAIERLLSYVRELGDDVKGHRVIIGHTGAYKLADILADRLRAEYGEDLNLEIVVTNPTAGAHCGPNGVGVAFHAIHR